VHVSVHVNVCVFTCSNTTCVGEGRGMMFRSRGMSNGFGILLQKFPKISPTVILLSRFSSELTFDHRYMMISAASCNTHCSTATLQHTLQHTLLPDDIRRELQHTLQHCNTHCDTHCNKHCYLMMSAASSRLQRIFQYCQANSA